MSDVRTDKGFNKMTPFWMCRKWSIFFLISSTLLYVTLSSVKEFKKTMTSTLAGNDRRIMGRSSSKLFWNGVPDRIILSGTPFQNNFEELRIIIRLLLPTNDEAMDFFNTLTDNVTYTRIYI